MRIDPRPAVALAFCAACAGSAPDATDAPVEVWEVAPDPIVVIGEDDTRPGHALNSVGSAHLLEDGALLIANRADSELRIFEPDGTLRRVIGGRGAGPQEFRILQQTRLLDGDTLAVLEGRRIAVVHPDHGVIRRIDFQIPRHADRCLFTENLVTVLGLRSLVVGWKEGGLPGCRTAPEGAFRRSAEFWLFNPISQEITTVGSFPVDERFGISPRPFGRTLVIAPLGDAVAFGETGGAWIQIYDPASGRLDTIPSPLSSRFLSEDMIGSQWPSRSSGARSTLRKLPNTSAARQYRIPFRHSPP